VGPARAGPTLAPSLSDPARPTASSAAARHVADAVLKDDSRGARLAKEHNDSKRRIDAAVAAVMAHDRAAILAGDRGPSTYA
jgi:hypothetical protein